MHKRSRRATLGMALVVFGAACGSEPPPPPTSPSPPPPALAVTAAPPLRRRPSPPSADAMFGALASEFLEGYLRTSRFRRRTLATTASTGGGPTRARRATPSSAPSSSACETDSRRSPLRASPIRTRSTRASCSTRSARCSSRSTSSRTTRKTRSITRASSATGSTRSSRARSPRCPSACGAFARGSRACRHRRGREDAPAHAAADPHRDGHRAGEGSRRSLRPRARGLDRPGAGDARRPRGGRQGGRRLAAGPADVLREGSPAAQHGIVPHGPRALRQDPPLRRGGRRRRRRSSSPTPGPRWIKRWTRWWRPRASSGRRWASGPVPPSGTPDEQRALVRRVLASLGDDATDPKTIVADATKLLGDATRFVQEHDLVGVPAEPCRVIEMPEYRRGVAIAYCDSSGPLEKKQETVYAIAPAPRSLAGEARRVVLPRIQQEHARGPHGARGDAGALPAGDARQRVPLGRAGGLPGRRVRRGLGRLRRVAHGQARVRRSTRAHAAPEDAPPGVRERRPRPRHPRRSDGREGGARR